MNTFLARANTIFAFTLTVLAALTFGCFLTTAFNDHSSIVVIDSTTALVYVKPIQMASSFDVFFHVRPWLLLRRCNLSNIGDRVRNMPSNAENNTNPNPNIYTATYV